MRLRLSLLSPQRLCGFVLGCLAVAPAYGAITLLQLSPTVYQTEHCIFIIDTSVSWASPTTAYTEIYLPSGGTFPRLSSYFDTLTTAFPASYFSICYIAQTGASNVPNYIDQTFKASGIQEPGTAGAPQSFSTVDFCRYNLGAGSVFTPALAVYDHELGHAWGAQIFHTLSPPSLSNGHWLANSTVDCQLSATYSDDGYGSVSKIYGNPSTGFRWQRVSNLRSNDTEVFSEQELYSMGVSATFPTAYVLNTPVYNADHTMSYSGVDTFDHAAVVGKYGARNPSYQTADKQFRLGFVYVARDVAEINSVYQAIEQSIDHFCNAEAIDSAGYRFQTPFLANARYRASVVGRLSNLDGNAPPALTVTDTYVTSSNGAATVAFTASDDSGIAPSVSIVPASNHCTISGNNVQLSGLPDGAHFFTLKALDGGGKKSFGHFVVEVQRPAPGVTISAQPTDRAVSAGAATTFSVTASSSSGLTYRWMREAVATSTWNDLNDGSAYSGTTTSTLSVTTSTPMSSDRFLCLVSNASGAVTSSVATLIVDEVAPPITTQPADQSLPVGYIAHFNISVAGPPSTFGYNTYQWQQRPAGASSWADLVDGSGISGATTASLSRASISVAMSGDQFRCVVSNTSGPIVSSVATLSVSSLPSITAQPQSVTSAAGQDVTFTVTATGSAPLTYQWYKYASPVAGGTGASLVLHSVQTGDAGAYTVVISNSAGSTTSSIASLVVSAAAPSITTHPQNVSTTAGQSVSFSVTATGTAPLSYQWRKAGVAISGATGATLILANVQSSDVANYSVVVTNGSGSAISGNATLTITIAATGPSITAQPQSQSVADGQTVSFSVTVSGTSPFTYQWRKSGTAISGATAENLALGAVHTSDAADYSVVITNSVGAVTSATATLTVTVTTAVNAPVLTTQPVNATVTAGQNASFSVTASGTGPLTYQWQRNGTAIGGGSAATLSLVSVQAADAGTYTAVVSNAAGSVTSVGATLTVLSAQTVPVILAQPTSVTVVAGASASLSVTAVGSPSPGYQWLFNGSPLGGETSSILVLSNVQAGNAGAYRVVVSNSAGSVQSSSAALALFTADFSAFDQGSFLINIASRGVAGADERTLIAGFVITGSETKDVLIRAIGPTLGSLGVSGALIDPRLKLFRGSTEILENDDWGSAGSSIASISTALGAFSLPVGSHDAVLLTHLAPGAYTAQVITKSGATGVAMIEVYDAGPVSNTASKLVNISTRAYIGRSENILIAGLVITGDAPKKVLVRGVGPALGPLGVNGALADPMIKLFQGSVVLKENDNWGDSPDAVLIAATASQVGAFALPAGSKDSALIVYLLPGPYTVQVSGVGDTTGIGMVEVYEVTD